ncbi:ankyrin repeat-containing domain protein [Xylariaceae sp. FL0662B]|nr:ankyrin repeat-containing domain protein [Xylariaceae sp. FL0662B]
MIHYGASVNTFWDGETENGNLAYDRLEFSQTPLTTAVAYLNLQVVKHLVANGADVNAMDLFNHHSTASPIHWAVATRPKSSESWAEESRYAIINVLLDAGCNLTQYNSRPLVPHFSIKSPLEPPLNIALANPIVPPNTIKLLLDRGAFVGQPPPIPLFLLPRPYSTLGFYLTSLSPYYPAENYPPGVYIHPDYRDSSGKIGSAHRAKLHLLLDRISVADATKFLRSYLFLSPVGLMLELLEIFIDHEPDLDGLFNSSHTLLTLAMLGFVRGVSIVQQHPGALGQMEQDAEKMFKLLLGAGANPDGAASVVIDPGKPIRGSPLSMLIGGVSSVSVCTYFSRFFLENGASANTVYYDGVSLLHMAVQYELVDVVEALLTANPPAAVDAVDDLGNTALHYACGERTLCKIPGVASCVDEMAFPLVRLLTQYGANCAIENNAGHQAIDLATERDLPKTVDLLSRY